MNRRRRRVVLAVVARVIGACTRSTTNESHFKVRTPDAPALQLHHRPNALRRLEPNRRGGGRRAAGHLREWSWRPGHSRRDPRCLQYLERKRDVILFCIDCSESMLALRDDPAYEGEVKTCHLYTA